MELPSHFIYNIAVALEKPWWILNFLLVNKQSYAVMNQYGLLEFLVDKAFYYSANRRSLLQKLITLGIHAKLQPSSLLHYVGMRTLEKLESIPIGTDIEKFIINDASQSPYKAMRYSKLALRSGNETLLSAYVWKMESGETLPKYLDKIRYWEKLTKNLLIWCIHAGLMDLEDINIRKYFRDPDIRNFLSSWIPTIKPDSKSLNHYRAIRLSQLDMRDIMLLFRLDLKTGSSNNHPLQRSGFWIYHVS